jgi:hypothetical protein
MVMAKLKAIFADDQPDERRRDPRQRVLLQASIYPVTQCGEVTIRNASQTGLMGETDLHLEIGQTLHLSFDDANHHSGVVRWTRGRRFGLALDGALEHLADADQLDGAVADGQAPRARRIELNLKARLMTGPGSRTAMVKDVSRSGMLLDNIHCLKVGQQLLVQLRDRAPILGTIQWCAGSRAGLRTAGRIATLRLVYSAD